MRLNAVMQKRGDWYIGFIKEIPGTNSQGKTLEELRNNLKEATQLILQAKAELASKLQGRQHRCRKLRIPLIRKR